MGAKASAAATQPINITADQVRRARLTVAHFSQDAEDCARLLDVLGLDGPIVTRVSNSFPPATPIA